VVANCSHGLIGDEGLRGPCQRSYFQMKDAMSDGIDARCDCRKLFSQ